MKKLTFFILATNLSIYAYAQPMHKARIPQQHLVYALHHDSSLHVYVGKSTSGLHRPKSHGSPSNLRKPFPVARWIQKLRSQGYNYQILVLENCLSSDEANESERFYIALFRSIGMSLLNITDGGDAGFSGGRHTVETRAIISTVHKGKAKSASQREKMRESRNALSPEVKAKIAAASSLATKGKPLSIETRAKLSARPVDMEHMKRITKLASERVISKEERAKRSAVTTAMNKRRGPHSEQTKEKISKALMGHRLPDESYARGAEKRRGRKHSEETKERMSNAAKGRVHSEESRAKMSDSQKKKAPPTEEARRNMSAAGQRRAARERANRLPRIRINLGVV